MQKRVLYKYNLWTSILATIVTSVKTYTATFIVAHIKHRSFFGYIWFSFAWLLKVVIRTLLYSSTFNLVTTNHMLLPTQRRKCGIISMIQAKTGLFVSETNICWLNHWKYNFTWTILGFESSKVSHNHCYKMHQLRLDDKKPWDFLRFGLLNQFHNKN